MPIIWFIQSSSFCLAASLLVFLLGVSGVAMRVRSLALVRGSFLSTCDHAEVRDGGKWSRKDCDMKCSGSACEVLRTYFDVLRTSFESPRTGTVFEVRSFQMRVKLQKSLGFRRKNIDRCGREQVKRGFVSRVRRT